MSKFHVGQRVRFLGAPIVKASAAGREGVVATIAPTTSGAGMLYPMVVELLCGRRICASPDLIEPLNPPKSQELITWDAACFDRDGKYRQPEVVAA